MSSAFKELEDLMVGIDQGFGIVRLITAIEVHLNAVEFVWNLWEIQANMIVLGQEALAVGRQTLTPQRVKPPPRSFQRDMNATLTPFQDYTNRL